MCSPAIAGMALGGVGQVVNGMEANANNRRIIEARNAATQAELKRQHEYQTQSGGIFDASLGNFAPAVQTQRLGDAQTADRGFLASNAPTADQVGNIGFGDAGAASKAAAAQSLAQIFAANAARSDALGKLSGWDTLGFENKVGLAGSGRSLGTISNLSSNSARVGDLEREVAAENAYRPPSGLGSIIGFAGNMLAGRGGTSMPTFNLFGK